MIVWIEKFEKKGLIAGSRLKKKIEFMRYLR